MHVKWMRSTRPLSAAALTALVVVPSYFSDVKAQSVLSKEPFSVTITGSDNFAGQYAKEAYPAIKDPTVIGENGEFRPPLPTNNQFFNLATLRLYVDGKSDVLNYGAQFWVNLADTSLSNGVAFGYVSKDDLGKLSFGRQRSLDWSGFDSSFTWGTTNNKFGDPSSERGFGPNYNWGQAAVGYGGINTRADAISATLGEGTGSGVYGTTRLTYVTPKFYGLQFGISYGIDSGASDAKAARYDYVYATNLSDRTGEGKRGDGVKNPLELGLRYVNNDLGNGFGLNLAAGYVTAKPKRYDPTAYGLQNVSAFGTRVGLSWGGLLGQFVYNNAGKSLQPTRNTDGEVLSGQNQQGFSTSLAYAFTGNQVGFYFARGRAATGVDGVDPGGSSLGNDTVVSYGIGGHHYLADGVKVYLGVENVKADNQSVGSVRLDPSANPYVTGAAVPRWSNKTTVVTLGTTIEF